MASPFQFVMTHISQHLQGATSGDQPTTDGHLPDTVELTVQWGPETNIQHYCGKGFLFLELYLCECVQSS